MGCGNTQQLKFILNVLKVILRVLSIPAVLVLLNVICKWLISQSNNDVLRDLTIPVM
jgi:hypothetical protein